MFLTVHDTMLKDMHRFRANDHVVYCARTGIQLQPALCQLALRLFGVLVSGVDPQVRHKLPVRPNCPPPL